MFKQNKSKMLVYMYNIQLHPVSYDNFICMQNICTFGGFRMYLFLLHFKNYYTVISV